MTLDEAIQNGENLVEQAMENIFRDPFRRGSRAQNRVRIFRQEKTKYCPNYSLVGNDSVMAQGW